MNKKRECQHEFTQVVYVDYQHGGFRTVKWHCKKCFRLKPKSLTTSTKVKNGGKTKTTRLRKRKMYTTSSTSTTTTLPYTLPYTYMKYEITFWERIMRFFGF